MIEPEIAFADLADDADLAEDFLKYIFRAVLDERADDMAFFAERIDQDAVTRLEAFIDAELRAHDYTEAIDAPRARRGRSCRVPRRVGHRPADRARALPDRGARAAGPSS